MRVDVFLGEGDGFDGEVVALELWFVKWIGASFN